MTTGATLGDRLQKARGEMTLDELADRIGVRGGRRTIIRWEQDENVPSPEYRIALTREFSLPDDFFASVPPQEARLVRRVAALEAAVSRIERQLFGAGAPRVP